MSASADSMAEANDKAPVGGGGDVSGGASSSNHQAVSSREQHPGARGVDDVDGAACLTTADMSFDQDVTDEALFARVPSLRHVPDDMYPLMLTYRQYLVLLDSCLERPFFKSLMTGHNAGHGGDVIVGGGMGSDDDDDSYSAGSSESERGESVSEEEEEEEEEEEVLQAGSMMRGGDAAEVDFHR